MSKIEEIAAKYIAENYITTEEWLSIPGKGLTWYENIGIISSKLIQSDEQSALVEVHFEIEVKLAIEDEIEEDLEHRIVEVCLEQQSGEWFVDNVDEI